MNYWIKFANDTADAVLETLLWSETDDNGKSFENRDSDLHESVHLMILGMVCGFLEEQNTRDRITALDLTAEQVGHNLVLSANGHGSGFWDRGWGFPGDRLNEEAKMFPSSLYEGDDGFIYFA